MTLKVKFVALNEVFHICCQKKNSAKLKEKVNFAVKPRKGASSTECTDVLCLHVNSSSFSNSLSYLKQSNSKQISDSMLFPPFHRACMAKFLHFEFDIKTTEMFPENMIYSSVVSLS